MRDSLLAQRALYAVLVDAIEIDTRPDPVDVFDQVDPDFNRDLPPELQRPYVVVGEMYESPADTHDGFGSIETAVLHTWSRAPGASEVKAVMGATDELLHQRTLTMEDARRVRVTREFAEIITEETAGGERWRHGIARYRIRTLDLSPIADDYYA